MQTRRVEAVRCLFEESMKEQTAMLKIMDGKLDTQSKSSELISSKVSQVRSIVIDMKALLDFFRSSMLVQHATPQGLGTHWQQAPVTLEDALGYQIPLPLELVNSWDVSNSQTTDACPYHLLIFLRV
jgi:hypothetical protein